jgi:catechol-2,3-dioxygenase
VGVPSREADRAWLEAGPQCRLGIWSPGEKEHRDRGGTHVHFALSVSRGRLDEVAAGLHALDWEFEGPVTHEGGDRSLYLSDPEGNRVEVWDYFEDRRGAPA